jgi:hypothetical protein
MEDGDRKAFISRIGTFFVLIGVLVVVLFIASDVGEVTYFQYFFIGVILLSAGLIFKRMTASPAPPGKRFEGIRTLQKKIRDGKGNSGGKKEPAKGGSPPKK